MPHGMHGDALNSPAGCSTTASTSVHESCITFVHVHEGVSHGHQHLQHCTKPDVPMPLTPQQACLKVANVRGLVSVLQAIKASSSNQVPQQPTACSSIELMRAADRHRLPRAAVHRHSAHRRPFNPLGGRVQEPAGIGVPAQGGAADWRCFPCGAVTCAAAPH